MKRGAALLLLATATALLFACAHNKPRTPNQIVDVSAPGAEPPHFLGDAACVDCHPKAAADQAHTRHAATLRAMDASSLGAMAPPTGKLPGTDIQLARSGGGYAFSVEGDTLPLRLAVGSGKTGMTYLAQLDEKTALELRMSYFPASHMWYLTPGHEKRPAGDVGLIYDVKAARQCLSCHATTLPDYGFDPEPKYYGVGCESCHGPGSTHTEAVRVGRKDLAVEKIGTWPARKVNDLCGKCHRSEQAAMAGGHQSAITARFQSYGLMKSRCFKESGEQLSCTTCHNPHQNAETNQTKYETICLTCHSGKQEAGGKAQQPNNPTTQQPVSQHPTPNTPRSCPVNPVSGCIPCHMPSRPIFATATVPTRMADHLIAIYRR